MEREALRPPRIADGFHGPICVAALFNTIASI
jgi:hypothetical protein